jgi:hypothetical protein
MGGAGMLAAGGNYIEFLPRYVVLIRTTHSWCGITWWCAVGGCHGRRLWYVLFPMHVYLLICLIGGFDGGGDFGDF